MNQFTELSEYSRKIGETGDCTVKAFAVVTGYSYDEAWEEMRKVGREYRKGLVSNYPHYNDRMIKALAKNGFKAIKVKSNSKTLNLWEE